MLRERIRSTSNTHHFHTVHKAFTHHLHIIHTANFKESKFLLNCDLIMRSTLYLLYESPKPKIQQVRQHYDTIEAALAQGYTHAQVHAWLRQQGVDINFRYYETALHRIRRHKSKDGSTVQPIVQRPNGPSDVVLPSKSRLVGGNTDSSSRNESFTFDVKTPPRW
jgi:hypothetical protein